jgi:hypothetical protein
MGWSLVGLAGAQLASKTCDCTVRWVLTKRRLPSYLRVMGPQDHPSREALRLPPGLAREIAKFWRESTVLVLLAIVVWNRSEMIFLKRFCDIRQVAFYSVAFGLSLFPAGLVGPFSRAAAVSVFAEQGRSAKAGRQVANLYWRYLVLLLLPACLGLAVLSGPLVRILYGVQYHQAAPVLMLAAAFSMFAPLANPATSLVTAAGGQGRIVVGGLVAAVATLALDYWLVRYHAAIGGALANGLGQVISTIIIIAIAQVREFPHFARFHTAGMPSGTWNGGDSGAVRARGAGHRGHCWRAIARRSGICRIPEDRTNGGRAGS